MKKIISAFLVVFSGIFLFGCSLDKNTSKDERTNFMDDVSVGYQIFVTSFADGDKSNNVPGEFSGDIQGIIDHLDYLKDDLGVDCLWLTPVHKADSYHGYDVIDYFSINDAFGGMEKYEELLAEAHKRGMYVLLDFVINHTSVNSEWFKSAIEGDPKYENYYRFKDNGGSGYSKIGNRYYYSFFGGSMPDLNYDNDETYNEMLNAAKFWLDKGVDGFRVDGAKHVYNTTGSWETEDSNIAGTLFFEKFSADVKEYKEDAFILCEIYDSNPGTIAKFYTGMDSAFNFAMQSSIANAIANESSISISGLYSGMDNIYRSKNANYVDSVFLSNHDLQRIYNSVGKNPNKAKLASSILFTLPGISWIYYGDELGMSGQASSASYADMAYRQPFVWKNDYDCLPSVIGSASTKWDLRNQQILTIDDQKGLPSSIFNHYSNWSKLKSTDDVLRKGDLKDVYFGESTYAYTRSYNGKTYLVCHNLTKDEVTVEYDLKGASFVVDSGAKMTDAKLTLKGYQSAVILLDAASKGGGIVQKRGITCHFYNSDSWARVGYYTWDTIGDSTTGDWPGLLMDNEGNGWYKCIISNATSTNIIFNNNVPDGSTTEKKLQTADLSVEAGEWWFYNGKWYDEKPNI